METVLRVGRILLSLLGLIAVLILLPAMGLGIAGEWQIAFLTFSYFCFFLGTLWRVVRHGKLVERRNDRQIQHLSGQIASVFALFGLLGVHWIALYEFSQNRSVGGVGEQWLGAAAIALILIAILLSQIAIRTIGKFFDRLSIKPDHRLVTHGIYRSIRHPIYTSYILLFVGWCTMLQSPVSFGLLFIVCVVWFGNRITIEEEMLIERFGEEYQSYCKNTKRLFPYLY
ncbi:isoprenylcysteine carboxylmethyltransferase family protein [Lusitaniella coriacea LEGE 07157]|uniref:Isoprenylcysteine carboxylmethyltransferase family protein n=1 Tax=Lusitaniella coriacea LEGE 07157 TaxID=945747 RepID=A0A8J7DY81_9CYAN|nr:isoprenylcysteine carboxylmethyltransferase family protein [Lusitaniella coriacea]MBE9117305.1 isoprenylcysteine carboxylmethyltransferase family protein [Lusitaniella coriacea LEGE 07157]